MSHLTMLDITKAGVPSTLPSSVTAEVVSALASSAIIENHQIRWLRPRFAIFDQDTNDDVATLCSSTSPLERYLAVGYYTDILYNFEPFLRSDGTRVGSTELLLTHLLSVSRLFDSSIRMEYVLVELIFQMICAVPAHDSYNAGHSLTHSLTHPFTHSLTHSGYYRILLELCKRYSTYPIVIAQGTSLLYQMLPEMDTIVVMELGRYSLTHSLTYSLTHSLTHSLTQVASVSSIKYLTELAILDALGIRNGQWWWCGSDESSLVHIYRHR